MFDNTSRKMTSTSKNTILVVEKANFTSTTLQTVPSDVNLPSLPPNALRVRSHILSMTANTLTYCNLGDVLGWWSTFPVPAGLPAPYNDSNVYGISPAWGYATVLESTHSSVEAGQLIWGYFPLSTYPVDLQFDVSSPPGTAKGHLIETSPHRASLMPLYQRYIPISADTSKKSTEIQLATDSLIKVLWECGYLLNTHIYTPSLLQSNIKPSHPMGVDAGPNAQWTNEDADLSSAVVVSLAASGKTALSVARELKASRPEGAGPIAHVALTSLRSQPFVEKTGLYDSTSIYTDLTLSPAAIIQEKILSHNPKRVVIINYGGSNAVVGALLGTIPAITPTVSTTLVIIAGEPKVLSKEDKAALAAMLTSKAEAQDSDAAKPKIQAVVQSNASGQREAAMKALGEDKYFEAVNTAWTKFRDGTETEFGLQSLGISVQLGEGMHGEKGVQGIWERLCRGDARPDIGLVVKLA
jgi:hypothetical protein